MIDEYRLVVVDVLNFNAHQPCRTLQRVFAPGRVSRYHGQRVRTPDFVIERPFGRDHAAFRVQREGSQVVHAVRGDKVVSHGGVFPGVGVLSIELSNQQTFVLFFLDERQKLVVAYKNRRIVIGVFDVNTDSCLVRPAQLQRMK